MGRFEVTLYQPGVYNPSTGKAVSYLLYDVGSGDKDYLLNGTLKLEVNKAGTFEFDILPSHTYYSMLRRYIHYVCIKEYATGSAIDDSDYIPIDIDLDPDAGSYPAPPVVYLGDTKIMFYGRILSMHMSFNGMKHVVCEGLMANLLDCPMYNTSPTTVEKIFTLNGTPSWMFHKGISAYRNLIRTDIYAGYTHNEANAYAFEEVDVSGGTSVGDFITGELVDAHGGFLDMQYRQLTDGSIVGFLNWLADPSMSEYSEETIDQTIEFGENLLDLSGENTDDEVTTGIIPTWEDSNKIKKWIAVTSTDVDDPQKTVYKPHIVGSSGGVGSAGIKIVDIPCTKTQDGAMSYATTYVEKYCDYNLSSIDFDSYTVRALDFHYINQESKHKIDLYNRVRILCEPHSIDKVLLCTSAEILIDSPENSSYTFSVYRPKASSNEKTLTRQLGGRSGGNASNSEVSSLSSRVSAQEAKSSSYLTVETDPTVPAWAKASTKPSYTAQEVGALPANTKLPSKTSDLTNNGDGNSKFATVSQIPTKISELTNDGNGTYNFATTDQLPINTSELTNDGEGSSKFATVDKIPIKTSDLTNDGDGVSLFARLADIKENHIRLRGPSQIEENVEKFISDQFQYVCDRFNDGDIIPVSIDDDFLRLYNSDISYDVHGLLKLSNPQGGSPSFEFIGYAIHDRGALSANCDIECGWLDSPYMGTYSCYIFKLPMNYIPKY